MAKKVKVKAFETTDKEKIISYIESKSLYMYEYMNNHFDSEYLMVHKHITHSDLPNKGKRNGIKQTINRNYLYYLSTGEMQELERQQGVEFESAKQSNIGVSTKLFVALGIEQLQRRKGQQKNKHEHIVLNDYADVYLVNDTLKYFDYEYSNKIFEKLNKKPSWGMKEAKLDLADGDLTRVKITHAIHGLGTADDELFYKLRLNIFKNDTIVFIVEARPSGEKNMFVLLEKNPTFFTLIGETNKTWEKFATKQMQLEESKLKAKTVADIDEEEKTRRQQAKWRDMLAEEMMNYSTKEGEVFCPFTYLTCDYEAVGTLFRASHIKPYKDCDYSEAYDLNNGLLLCANADALFDKHLITIDENKELVFSFLLKHNSQLISKLLLTQPIFQMILNDERMNYLKEHREEFYKLEAERKKK